jgi:hypothetical protein
MAATRGAPAIDESDKLSRIEPAAEIELEQLRAAERNPEIKAFVQEAIAEGERVVREGRRHW